MKRILSIFLYCLALAILSGSCAPEACLEETESFLKASLYENSTRKSPDSLTLYGINHETDKIYNKASGVQPALFPLDKSADNCTFIIRINGTNDTIQFNYTSRLHFISKECGYTVYHNLVDTPYYTKHIIDKIYIAGRNITNVNEENIRIFY
jgi:hypothetical protein